MGIKSFRGLIANSTEERIQLHTNTGKTGYRIVKFQLMGTSENKDYETSVQIYSISQQGSFTEDVDFSDNTLLAAGLYGDSTSGSVQNSQIVIFDNVKFNQDIFIVHKASSGSSAINYYIELETEDLTLDENTVATLKDIRNISRNAD